MEDISTAISALNTGDLLQAETVCQRIINKYPQQVQALHLMGIVGSMQGRLVKAISYFKRAHQLDPDDTDILLNLGCSQLQLGKLGDAESSLRRVLQMKPDEALAHSSLGNVLKRLGRFEEAIVCHRNAVSLMPSSAEAYSNLASAYLSWDKIDLAVEEYRKAINLKPESPEFHYNLGTALQKGEEYEKACASFRLTIELTPDHDRAHMNMGSSLKALGRLDEAIGYLRRATELAPNSADAHWNLALALLMAGDYINGWKAYEWRLKISDIPIQKFPQSIWDGSVQPDKTLLIHAEQGMGDTIQFVRYASVARTKVKRVILYCQEPLVRLLYDIKGIDQVVSIGQSLPRFDLQLPLLNLPGALGATLENIPHKEPYLKTDLSLIEKWRSKINSRKFKVGLVWAGNPKHEDDHNRSIELSAFAQLIKMPDLTFYSLQKERSDTQSNNKAEDANLIDTGSELTDFADTAALISNLDIIISVDTAVAHLAGALGRPVWILLPYAPDWRWMLEREDTPWYPTMRLFRQSRFGDWYDVIANVEEALKELLGT